MSNIIQKQLYLILVSLVIVGCSSLKNTQVPKGNSEEYYQKAFGILNNTTHNALSNSLALQALDYINTAISIDSKKSKYHRVKGTIYIHLKAYKTAIPHFKKAIQIDSTNSLAWMGLGIAFENESKFKLAEDHYFEALNDKELAPTIFFNLGLLYSKWNKYDLSITAYNNAIQISPNYRGAYLNRGKVKLTVKKYTESISDFNRAISLDSTDKVALNNRGLAKYYLKQYTEAIKDFKKALEIDLGQSFNENFNTNKYAYNNIANAYSKLNDIENACIYWNKALKNGYVYKAEWKEEYDIDDPVILINKYCK